MSHSLASHYCHQLTFTDGLLVFAEHVIHGVDGGGEHHEAAGDQQPQGDQGRPGVSRGLQTTMLCGVNRKLDKLYKSKQNRHTSVNSVTIDMGFCVVVEKSQLITLKIGLSSSS